MVNSDAFFKIPNMFSSDGVFKFPKMIYGTLVNIYVDLLIFTRIAGTS